MAVVATKTSSRSANAVTMAAASAGGDKFTNTGKELLLVDHTNSGGSSVTLTITTTATQDGLAVADRTVTIAAGERHLLGPFPKALYNDENGQVSLGWSSETDIELAVLLSA